MTPDRRRGAGPSARAAAAVVGLVAAVALHGCRGESVPPELRPDSVLMEELGLTEDDRVHRILLTSGEEEDPAPDSVSVTAGAWVEFVTGDWRVHEVRFDLEAASPAGRSFLETTDQVASPPLVDRGARFVVSFGDAPPGRYPFVVEGNSRAARGVVVVVPTP